MSLMLLAYSVFFTSTAPLTLSQSTSQATSHSGAKTPRAIQKRCLMSVSLSNLILAMDHSRRRLGSGDAGEQFFGCRARPVSEGHLTKLCTRLALPRSRFGLCEPIDLALFARALARQASATTAATALLARNARIGRVEAHQLVGRRVFIPEEEDDELVA